MSVRVKIPSSISSSGWKISSSVWTPEMMKIIIKIMVEVLTILAIATKEIKQGRTSASFTFDYIAVLLNSLQKYF